MNSVNIQGRWTKNPELKYTPNGKAVANGTVAVQKKYKDQNTGEYGADFIQVVIWGTIAETICNRQEKGNRIGITGRIETRTWETDGKRNYATEVIAESVDIIDWADNGQGGQNQNRQGNQGRQNQGQGNQQWRNNDPDPFAGAGQIDIPDDDLPF